MLQHDRQVEKNADIVRNSETRMAKKEQRID